jgi:hypothetical protein
MFSITGEQTLTLASIVHADVPVYTREVDVY